MSFFYTLNGDYMKLYLDIIIFINFFLDYLLLLSVSILLKRRVNMYRIILGAFIGGLSILCLFYKINSIELFFIKFIISIFMILVSFGYKDIKYFISNVIYLYIISIFLGGGMYFINNSFSLKKKGIVFINNGYSINLIILVIISPIIIYIYNKQAKRLKNIYNNYYSVKIYCRDKYINVMGYMDTGNTLNYNHKPVLLLDKRKNIFEIKNYLLIPYNTIDNYSVLKGFKPDKVLINNRLVNCLIGLIDGVNFDGCDLILNGRIDIND